MLIFSSLTSLIITMGICLLAAHLVYTSFRDARHVQNIAVKPQAMDLSTKNMLIERN